MAQSVCENIRMAIAEAEEFNHKGERFFPRDKIANILTRDVVEQVLDCNCSRCQVHRGQIDENPGYPRMRVQAITSEDRPATSLFALFIYLQHSLFVTGFLTRQKDDDCISRTLEEFISRTTQLGEIYWRGFHLSHNRSSRGLEREFRQNLVQFIIPCLTTPYYHHFSRRTILPFVEEREIGRQEGAYGRVYAFKIWASYNKLPNATGIEWFARKELREGRSTRLFNSEMNNLHTAESLQDKHIVKVIKTYRHGEQYNIIFPLAKANLWSYLREEQYLGPQSSPPEANPLWEQFAGIANALHRILDFDARDLPSGDPGLYGFHFDLKPENILVENNNTWLIADFGQATFIERGGSSRVIGMGGTEAYAPPEIDSLDYYQSRRYDIWSLGCILVEFTTFVARGADGLKEFDALRVSSIGNRTDDRFFQRDENNDGFILKPQIQQWIDSLPDSPVRASSKSTNFLKKIVNLLSRMLEVNANRRASSDAVIGTLREIMETSRESSVSSADGEPAGPDEVALGKDLLKDIKIMWYTPMLHSNRIEARLFAFLRPRSGLRLMVHTSRGKFEATGSYQNLMLVPGYAFPKVDQDLYFRAINNSNNTFSFDKFNLSFKHEQDIRTVQSVLTHQNIMQSCSVKGVSYILHHSFWEIFRQLFSHSNCIPLNATGKACLVQLWHEMRHPFCESNTVTRERERPPRRSPRDDQALPRRLVILHEKQIVIIPFELNWTIVKLTQETSNVGGRTELQLQLRYPSIDKYFTGFTLDPVLKAPRKVDYPGIPVNPKDLAKATEKNNYRFSSIEIEFHNSHECSAFLEKFEKMRKRLKAEAAGPVQVHRQ